MPAALAASAAAPASFSLRRISSAFVRAADNGISGFVDRRGRFHRPTALYEEAVVVHDVRLSSERTVYDRLGDGVVWLVLIGLGWSLLLALRR